MGIRKLGFYSGDLGARLLPVLHCWFLPFRNSPKGTVCVFAMCVFMVRSCLSVHIWRGTRAYRSRICFLWEMLIITNSYNKCNSKSWRCRVIRCIFLKWIQYNLMGVILPPIFGWFVVSCCILLTIIYGYMCFMICGVPTNTNSFLSSIVRKIRSSFLGNECFWDILTIILSNQNQI